MTSVTGRRPRFARRVIAWIVASFALALLAAGAWRHTDYRADYDFDAIRAAHASSDARLLDRHGRVIHELRVDPYGRRLEWTPLGSISPALVDAIVAAEDRRFFDHRGVDWFAALAAAAARITGGERGGASTLSMQLAALLDARIRAPGQRDLDHKWLQMRAALALEGVLDKREVLEAYLNLATFRGELQGVAAAALGLFDKDAAALTAPDSAILAALVRGPNAEPSRVARRACGVARRVDASASCDGIEARVAAALERGADLRQRVAEAPHVARHLLDGASRRVTSTLDGDVQAMARGALRETIAGLDGRNVRDGAVLVADNATGDVIAYVGNTGGNPAAFYVDGVRAPRQAGSTLKPFLYGLVIEQRRLTAASLLDDSPVSLSTPTGAYVPQNYDNRFRGPVSVRTALAGSLNVPAVRALMLAGVDAFADRLRAAGFAHVSEAGDYYGYSLALGSAEVSLWQLVAAYGALARDGELIPLTLTPRADKPASASVMSPGAAFIVADILADRGARAATFGLDNVLALPFPASVKTGTSKDMRDNWCVGFSDRFTVGVWVGNFDGEPMRDVSGVSGAAPVWARVMRALHADDTAVALAPPPGVARVTVDLGVVEPRRDEWFLAGTETRRITPLPVRSAAPRIVYPGHGMVMAVDADIPAARQRVFFEMSPGGDHAWRLNGRPVDAADGWQPVPGVHALELVDAGGTVVDHVTFTVRGG